MNLYRRLPKKRRDLAHRLLHDINTNEVLLRLGGQIRHNSTRRRIMKMTGEKKVMLGESTRYEGWISTNLQFLTRNYLDATKEMADQGSVNYFYADNVIEHLPVQAGMAMISKVFDALAPGGVVRIATPDGEAVCKAYLAGDSRSVEEFAVSLNDFGYSVTQPIDLVRFTFCAFGHSEGYIYDFETLSKIMTEVGFIKIRKYRPGNSEILVLQNLEKRTGAGDFWSQMCIEAVKPSRNT